jgi:folate-binding protein YgfZ
MRVIAVDDGRFALAVPHSSVDALVKRLSMFRLRARVDIATDSDGWLATAVRSSDDLARIESLGLLPEPSHFAARRRDGVVAIEIGGARRCVELFGPARAFGELRLDLRDELRNTAWALALIEAGVPHIEGAASEKFTVHMLNLDLLGAISLGKGCYPGQEIIARTAHLGQSKRRLARYRLGSGSASPGAPLEHDGRDAGEVVNACGPDLLAVVPLELFGTTLSLDGHSAVPAALPYRVPGAT